MLSLNRILKNKKYLEHGKTIVFRYFLYGIGIIEGLALPYFLVDAPNLYSDIEYYKNAILLFPNVLLGSYNGYTYVKYNYGIDYFPALLKIGLVSSVIVAAVLGFSVNLPFLIFPLIFINLFTVIEQRLRVEKKFNLAFAFKPVLAFFSMVLAFIYFKFDVNVTFDKFIFFTFLISFVLWFLLSSRFINYSGISLKISRKDLIKYYVLVKKIFTSLLATIVVGLLIFFERYLVGKYYSVELPTYTFGFKLSQIIVVLISSFSYLSNIFFGEKINLLNRNSLLKQLKVSLLSYSVLLIAFSLFLVIITPLYPQFNDILFVTLSIAAFKGFFFLTGIFSPIAVYKDFNNKLLIAITIISIINVSIALFIAINQFSIYLLFFVDGICISLYSLFILNIVFRKVKYS
ncbi:hypothetical protein [uncultured Arcticibacterium sp.]|uniref:hypothetical protein n=1 Tax=uncultured Arcticibacterium sp. TaxID=2173042 RepID=UPI0030F59F54